RARKPDTLEAVRRQFRDCPVLRRRVTDGRSGARPQELALRGWHRRSLLFHLRPDPRRFRRTAQPTDGGRSIHGHRLARAGLLMAEIVADSSPPVPPRRLRPDWPRRLLNELFALFIALLFGLAGLIVLLDSAPGHRFIVDRIAGFETASGLRIRIGRIDGSIFGKSQLRNVTVADAHGVFAASPNIKLDWAP